MNQYIGRRFAVLTSKKNILIVGEATSAGRWSSLNAAPSCSASSCLYDSVTRGFLLPGRYFNCNLPISSSGWGDGYDRRFLMKRADGGWKIDAAQERLDGWQRVGL